MSGVLQNLAIFFGALLLIASLLAGRMVRVDETKPSTAAATAKTYRTLLGKGVSIQTGAYPGLPLLYFDSCQIEKRSFHGFSLGGFNILRVEQLEVTIPQQSCETEGISAATETDRPQSPVDSLFDLKLKDLFQMTRPFSAVEVNGLAVYTGNSLDERTCLLEAQSAASQLDRRIALHECRVMTESGNYVSASKAWLCLGRPIRVMTKHWVVNLETQLLGSR